jgi:ribosomal protein S18 acetylase RimI-like enzyme
MNSSTASTQQPASGAYRVRALRPDDREPIERILRHTGVFSEEEVQVALELIDEGLAEPEARDAYRFVVAEAPDGRLAGYACYGSTPGMPGTYDLYWIAVEPALHGQGIGKILIYTVEEIVAHEGGDRIVVETSSRKDYTPTRAFYDHSGYNVESQEKDYYSPGDDKVVYVKRLEQGEPEAGR